MAVTTQVIQAVAEDALEEVPGTLRAVERATISAKASGRIEEMPVALGQALKQGDLIARVDAREAEARLEQAKASLEQATRDAQRVQALFVQQVATRAETDAAEARLRGTRGAVDEAQAALENSTMVAPFAGQVTRKYAEPGDLAQPGRPLIELENPAQMEVEADVPEALAAGLATGTELQVLIGTNLVAGRVRELSPSADPLTRTFRLKAEVKTPGRMQAGQFARVLVPIGRREVIRVPETALVRRGQLELVYLATDGRAQMHLVRSGKTLGGQVEILSGLENGDALVIEKAALLRDGQPLSIQQGSR